MIAGSSEGCLGGLKWVFGEMEDGPDTYLVETLKYEKARKVAECGNKIQDYKCIDLRHASVSGLVLVDGLGGLWLV